MTTTTTETKMNMAATTFVKHFLLLRLGFFMIL